ncbi:hypothetical protein HPB52_021888 [Rhipicephalus sanguineus]|uniref:Uncharacterized protein n=1 Tax=Rhipicephalus sanguineus TaxID=34632 RepID=A0A9D4Q0C1_RHISA|nr:hypothetical protein HPB52_021888 [Rhipicephalus sanguineus]
MDSAWCVPLLAAVATFLLTMPFTCFGLLFVLIMEKFGTTREQASWVESAFIMSSNLSGFAVKVFMASASIYTMLFFDKYRATAQSFISCAQGAAGMAGQTLLSRLERTYGLAGALVILGGILMHAVPLSMLLKEAHRIRFTSFLKKKASAFVANIVATSEITCSKKGYFRDSGGSYDNFYRMLGGINFLVTLQFALFLACRNRRKTAIEINNP